MSTTKIDKKHHVDKKRGVCKNTGLNKKLPKGFNMNLREYLFSSKITAKDFALKAGISKSYLSRLLNGATRPSKQMSSHIEKVTNGDVRAENIIGPGILAERKDEEV